MDKVIGTDISDKLTEKISNMPEVPALTLSPHQMVQLSPIFIASFMVMTSMFNGDVKAILWLVFCIVGISLTFVVNKYILFDDFVCPSILPLFNRMNNFSISTAFIVFTLGYLVMPMISNKDYNYYVIVGFLILLVVDIIVKQQLGCVSRQNYKSIIYGIIFGSAYSVLCYSILNNGAKSLLYFNTISSNNIYCSKPKKQTFKCNVYKNGEIISSL